MPDNPYVIVIGVGQYSPARVTAPRQLRLANLASVERGARRFAGTFVPLLSNGLQNKSRILCTATNDFPPDTAILVPTEDNVKALFEEGLTDIGPADPLILYWAGHGCLLRDSFGHRRLFYSDSNDCNGRNLNFESLYYRLTSEESQIKSLIVVVEACATSIDDSYLPSGNIVTGKPRTEKGRLERQLVIFSAIRGEAAYGMKDSEPIYTRLFLDNFDSTPSTDSIFERCEFALRKSTDTLVHNVADLARSWEFPPEVLAKQLPFTIVETTLTGAHISRPEIDKVLTDDNAIQLAQLWADQFKDLGAEFASTPAQRKRLKAYRSEIRDKSEVMRKWWDVGQRKARRARISQAAVAAVVLLIVAVSLALGLKIPASKLVAGLAQDDRVAEHLAGYSYPTSLIARSMLRDRVNWLHDDLDEPRARLAAARHRANAAMALLLFDDEKSLLQLLDGHGIPWYDPQARTHFILKAIATAGISPDRLLDLLQRDSITPRARQALILALGQSEVRLENDSRLMDRAKKLLLKDFAKHPDPGVHAAALWCFVSSFQDEGSLAELRSASEKLKSRGIGNLEEIAGERGWYVDTATGITMVVFLAEGKRLRIGDRDEKNPKSAYFQGECIIRNSFAMSMTEISQSHLEKLEHAELPIKARAISRISRDVAEAHCKTLSTLSPEGGFKISSVAFGLSSFRLPNEIEWEYACRGGSVAKFSFGDDSGDGHRTLARFATLAPESAEPPYLLNTMPNEFGLFEMHGGVTEWCANDFTVFPPDQKRDDIGSTRASLRGGNGVLRLGMGFNEKSIPNLYSFARVGDAESLPTRKEYGFRVVRTISRLLADAKNSDSLPD